MRAAGTVAALFAGLFLAACAAPPAPRGENVPTPIAVPCLPADLPPAPDMTPRGAFASMTPGEAAQVLVEEWLEVSAWIGRARPYLEACRRSE